MSPSDPIAVPRPGTVVGKRYRLDSVLGEGGMAVVWRATHTETDRPVALKLVRSSLVENEQARELFVREAKIAARVGRSEHIVDVLDAGIDDALRAPFLAMELLDGEPLDERLRREGPLPHAQAAVLFGHLAEALDQAHAAGVVHRDLKPQNLFLSRGRKGPILKVLDFGIAKVAEAAQQSSTQIGTPAYAAPEQLGPSWRAIAEGRGKSIAAVVSPQTDVWAVGLVVFEALTGSRSGDLWGATTLAELPLKVVLEPTPVASARAGERASHLPAGFDAWLARCLELDAQRRFASAGEALAALAPLLDAPGAGPAASAVAASPAAASSAAASAVAASAAASGGIPAVPPTIPPGEWGAPPPNVAASAPLPSAPPTGLPLGTQPSAAAAWSPQPAWTAPSSAPVAQSYATGSIGAAHGYASGAAPAAQGYGQGYAAAPAPGFHVTTGAGWAPAPPDPHLAAWAQSRRLELVMADVYGLRALGPWIFLPPVLSVGREARGPLADGTLSLVEMTRGDAVGRATGDDRAVLALVSTPRARARVSLRPRLAAGFADNVARGLKMLDNLVGVPQLGATSIGDPLFESHYELSAPSAAEGHAALPPALRGYLVHQQVRGTLEMRPGLVAVMHADVSRFEPRALDYLFGVVSAILAALP